ncbi:MAG: hypothetical protein WBS14_18260, partial [Rhodomicrobium sp.]
QQIPASICQPVPDAFVRIPSSERSSAKSPFRQVNEVSSPLQPLINMGKNAERDAVAALRRAYPGSWRALILEVETYLTDFCASQ